ncbi:CD209 antigen-like protein A isoform X2 [Alosa sapidissima]|uniref:CD209 antigen-like protein A isoform X2 n=1 Tax=Alosa sapidissima TaxID=34773 RepID=UPI001C093B85|nr:CD209 antigen-like protein A isoform X2 [Alosa sapidissima]
MAEDILVDVDNSEEGRSYWDQGDKISTSKIFNKMGIGRHSKKDSRLADGWIARKPSLYKVSSEKRSWQESRDSCLNMGADLIVVNDIEEQKFLLPYKNVWIGLSDTDNEGVWKWVDGTPLTIKYWAPGEPNNAGNEDCAEISSKAANPMKAWNDVPCYSSFQYICEDHF